MLASLLGINPSLARAAADFVEDQGGSSESGDSTFDPFSDYFGGWDVLLL